MIDLKKFCRKNYCSETLSEPFSEGDYTYAADGSILIRVDKITEIIKSYPTIKPEKILEENKINRNEIWIDPPKFEIIEKNCTECDGTGKVIVCKECDGKGSLEFSSNYNDYEVECQSCFGKDIENEKCGDCDGTSKYKEYSNPKIEKDIVIDGSLESIEIMLNGMYLEMIQDLPNIKIALQDSPVKPIKLKFDGGIGLLMPMKHLR